MRWLLTELKIAKQASWRKLPAPPPVSLKEDALFDFRSCAVPATLAQVVWLHTELQHDAELGIAPEKYLREDPPVALGLILPPHHARLEMAHRRALMQSTPSSGAVPPVRPGSQVPPVEPHSVGGLIELSAPASFSEFPATASQAEQWK